MKKEPARGCLGANSGEYNTGYTGKICTISKRKLTPAGQEPLLLIELCEDVSTGLPRDPGEAARLLGLASSTASTK